MQSYVFLLLLRFLIDFFAFVCFALLKRGLTMRLNVCIFSGEMGESMSSVADYEWGGGYRLIVGSS